MLKTDIIRKEFPYLTRVINLRATDGNGAGRLFADSTASSQLPQAVLENLANATFDYANIHRGEYNSSQKTTEDFERTYNISANLINADSWREIILGRNTTEMINLVARGTAFQFRDGDNIVVTRMEHNSNYVPWYSLSQNMAQVGRSIEVRVVDFDRKTGELDMKQMKKYIDSKTKLVGCTGASNFLGTKPNLPSISEIAHSSGYSQPDSSKGSYFLVDGAQLVPGCPVDVKEIGCDFLAWSFHKMAIPLGVGGLYGKKQILEQLDPFLYGGDMVEDVSEGNVTYKGLPWKFTAGTPNILGTIATGHGINFLINLGLGNLGDRTNPRTLGKQLETEILMNTPKDDFSIKYTVPAELQESFGRYLQENPDTYEMLTDPERRGVETRRRVNTAMTNIMNHEHELTARALEGLLENRHVTVYGPKDFRRRTSLVSFTLDQIPFETAAKAFNRKNVEFRHGPLCASLAHKHYGIEGSLRMGFYVYNTLDEVDRAVYAVNEVSGDLI